MCEPYRGSEPGVAWNWAIEIARLGHEVWVVTDSDDRKAEDAKQALFGDRLQIRFIRYHLPRRFESWVERLVGWRIAYILWNWGAYRCARKLHKARRFDIVQHITFGVARHPCWMGGLGIPFIFGPAGGGERAPWRLRIGYPIRGWIGDGARDLANFAVRFDPFMHLTFDRATSILLKTAETRAMIPARYAHKTKVQLEIGIAPPPQERLARRANLAGAPLRILYVGRMVYWKGVHLALDAFAEHLKSTPDTRLTLIGKGPDTEWLKKRAERLGIADSIEWIPWLEQSRLWDVYIAHHLCLFPSLHDSSGNVVLEAIAHGLPVVCLDLGGPGVIIDDACGRVVQTRRQSRQAVVRGLADALTELASDSELRERLSDGALAKAQRFRWSDAVAPVYPDASRAAA